MTLPETIRESVRRTLERFCEGRGVPENLRYGVALRGERVTLFEERPSIFDRAEWTRLSVAQFRYSRAQKTWTLFCADRNSRWHRYTRTRPAPTIDKLLVEVDRDPTGIFWG